MFSQTFASVDIALAIFSRWGERRAWSKYRFRLKTHVSICRESERERERDREREKERKREREKERKREIKIDR